MIDRSKIYKLEPKVLYREVLKWSAPEKLYLKKKKSEHTELCQMVSEIECNDFYLPLIQEGMQKV